VSVYLIAFPDASPEAMEKVKNLWAADSHYEINDRLIMIKSTDRSSTSIVRGRLGFEDLVTSPRHLIVDIGDASGILSSGAVDWLNAAR